LKKEVREEGIHKDGSDLGELWVSGKESEVWKGLKASGGPKIRELEGIFQGGRVIFPGWREGGGRKGGHIKRDGHLFLGGEQKVQRAPSIGGEKLLFRDQWMSQPPLTKKRTGMPSPKTKEQTNDRERVK